MKKILLLFLLFPCISFAQKQDSIRTMFYNLYRFPTNSPANREFLLKEIMKEAQPDLLMACEIVTKDGSDRILNTSFKDLKDSFAAPEFIYCPTATDDPLQQMVYYNTRKLKLLSQHRIETIIRDINHYSFLVNKVETPDDSIFLEVFVTHLKAGSTNNDRFLRATMADSFKQYLQQIPTNHFVLLSGDFNFYNDHESAYQKLLDTNTNIIMIDPVNAPGDWHDNPNFQKIHTQATRVSSAGFGIGGASGGMDDRFDFILMSENLKDNDQLYYLPDSYKSFGNNGNCFDSDINSDTCNGAYPQALRNLLFQMSDHTPVIMTLGLKGTFPKLNKTKIEKTTKKIKNEIYFPNGNQADETLQIEIRQSNGKVSKENLIIYDQLGRIYKKCPLGRNPKTVSINVSELSAGIYLIRYKDRFERFFKL